MSTKSELQKVTLEVVRDAALRQWPVNDFPTLESYVTQKNDGKTLPPIGDFQFADQADKETFEEIFWDLFLDKILTITQLPDPFAPQLAKGAFPRFRLHSEGMQKIEAELAGSQG